MVKEISIKLFYVVPGEGGGGGVVAGGGGARRCARDAAASPAPAHAAAPAGPAPPPFCAHPAHPAHHVKNERLSPHDSTASRSAHNIKYLIKFQYFNKSG